MQAVGRDLRGVLAFGAFGLGSMGPHVAQMDCIVFQKETASGDP